MILESSVSECNMRKYRKYSQVIDGFECILPPCLLLLTNTDLHEFNNKQFNIICQCISSAEREGR